MTAHAHRADLVARHRVSLRAAARGERRVHRDAAPAPRARPASCRATWAWTRAPDAGCGRWTRPRATTCAACRRRPRARAIRRASPGRRVRTRVRRPATRAPGPAGRARWPRASRHRRRRRRPGCDRSSPRPARARPRPRPERARTRAPDRSAGCRGPACATRPAAQGRRPRSRATPARTTARSKRARGRACRRRRRIRASPGARARVRRATARSATSLGGFAWLRLEPLPERVGRRERGGLAPANGAGERGERGPRLVLGGRHHRHEVTVAHHRDHARHCGHAGRVEGFDACTRRGDAQHAPVEHRRQHQVVDEARARRTPCREGRAWGSARPPPSSRPRLPASRGPWRRHRGRDRLRARRNRARGRLRRPPARRASAADLPAPPSATRPRRSACREFRHTPAPARCRTPAARGFPEVTPSSGLHAVDTGIMRTRSKSRSSPSATICASAVAMPWPISTLPGNTRTTPSGSNRIQRDSRGFTRRLAGSASGPPGGAAPRRNARFTVRAPRAARRERCDCAHRNGKDCARARHAPARRRARGPALGARPR